jgi:hypothetical protein
VVQNILEKLYPELIQLSRDEHEAWADLCKVLREAGAVTVIDLISPVAKDDTPGLKLLNQIRRWGKLSAAIAVEEKR